MAGLGSVHRALQVLEVVAAAGDGISAKAVARRLDYNLSTTYHLLASLVVDGYLVRLDDRRGFGLGPALPALHERMVAQLPVPRGIGAILRDAHDHARAAVLYAAFRDTDVVPVTSDDCADHTTGRVGDWRGALHATAVGKVLLASLPPGRRLEVLCRDGMAAHAPRTLTRHEDLDRDLESVSRRGVAVDVGEFRARTACVAAPVLAASGAPVGAVAVAVPVVPAGGPGSLWGRRARLEETVLHAATRASAALDPSSGQ